MRTWLTEGGSKDYSWNGYVEFVQARHVRNGRNNRSCLHLHHRDRLGRRSEGAPKRCSHVSRQAKSFMSEFRQ